jgi:hypothetical protein
VIRLSGRLVDRRDCIWLGDEVSPRGAGGVDDGVIAFEDAVREPVGAQILPDVFDRVQLRRARRRKISVMFFGTLRALVVCHVSLRWRPPGIDLAF